MIAGLLMTEVGVETKAKLRRNLNHVSTTKTQKNQTFTLYETRFRFRLIFRFISRFMIADAMSASAHCISTLPPLPSSVPPMIRAVDHVSNGRTTTACIPPPPSLRM